MEDEKLDFLKELVKDVPDHEEIKDKSKRKKKE
jgi:hypothetical protein